MDRHDKKNRETLIGTYAFLKIPMQELCNILTPGIVAVVDNHNTAKLLEKNLIKIGWARSYGDEEFPPENYQIATCMDKKLEYEDDVLVFLDKEEFLPMLISSGMAPEFLDDSYFVMRMEEKISDETIMEIEELKKWILSNLELVFSEIKTLIAMVENIDGISLDDPVLVIVFLIAGVWRQFFRTKLADEDFAEEWMLNFLKWGKKLLDERENLTGIYQSTEAVKHFLYKFIEEGNDVWIISLDEVKELGLDDIEENMIFYDDETYYVQEQMLKKICLQLTKVITFHQLKIELQNEGNLDCNELTKRNFTVKKSIDLGSDIVRKRFLALKKEAFVSDDGQYLEELIEMMNNAQEDVVYETGDF